MMRNKFFYGIAVIFLLLNSVSICESQVLQNASFESGPNLPARGYLGLNSGNNSITGWTIESGTVDYIGSFWRHSDGARSVDMNGSSAGTISQVVTTNLGEVYTLQFDLSGNSTCPGEDIKSLSVTVGDFSGRFDFDVSGTSNTNMGWETKSIQFTALSASSIIRFSSLEAGSFCGAAIDNVVIFDCAGNPNGTAVIDNCGVCQEPSSPDFNNCFDCNGTQNGTELLDSCGVCLEVSDPSFNQSCLDCNGIPNGGAIIDACGVCLETTDPSFNQSCADCFGTPNGTAVIDECGQCVELNGPTFNQTCLDCNGIVNGTAVIDDCGNCLEPSDPAFNQACADCNGLPYGTAVIDSCGICIEPSSPDFNQTCIDCNGVLNGNALVDGCGVCLDPNDADFAESCPYRSLIFIPDAFSPNGDATNDRFLVFGKEGYLRKIVSYRIFDRWGSLIYQKFDFDISRREFYWDGNVGDKASDQSVFVYQIEIEFIDGEVMLFKGNLSVVK